MRASSLFAVIAILLAVAVAVSLNRAPASPAEKAAASLHMLTLPPPELSAPKFAVTLLSHILNLIAWVNAFKPPPLRAFELSFAFAHTQGIHALVKLGVIDALGRAGANGLTLREVQSAVVAHARLTNPSYAKTPSPERLERMLQFAKVLDAADFDPATNKWYISTIGALFVQEGNDLSLSPILMHNAYEIDMAWRHLAPSILDNTNGFEVWTNKSIWKFYEENPELSSNFDRAMRGISLNFGKTLLLEYGPSIDEMARNLSRNVRVCDVGGGMGSIIVSIVKEQSNVDGVVIDLPGPIENAKAYIKEQALESRVSAVAQSFFDPIVPVCDVYLLKHIIHDWDNADSVKIIKSVRANAPAHARILLAENVIGTREGYFESMKRFIDMQMLAVFGDSKERTQAEYSVLMKQGGFEFTRLITSRGLFDFVEGRVAPK